jgi:hypothetical protein
VKFYIYIIACAIVKSLGPVFQLLKNYETPIPPWRTSDT